LNGRVDDGFLKIPLPPPEIGGAINFASGEEARMDNLLVLVVVAVGVQEPKTLIFLHTSGFEAHTVKDAITGQDSAEDIDESIEEWGFKERLYYIVGNSFNSISAPLPLGLLNRYLFHLTFRLRTTHLLRVK
jgi:hypothetical protein